MTELQAPLWLWGGGTYLVHVGSDGPLWLRITAGGRTQDLRLVNGNIVLGIRLPPESKWYPIVFEASKPGLRLDYFE
jgi:hypothetical protein